MAKYVGILNSEEASNFLSDLLEIESGKGTKVLINPDGRGNTTIYLKPKNAIYVMLLKTSFKDGVLYRSGWTKKFEEK